MSAVLSRRAVGGSIVRPGCRRRRRTTPRRALHHVERDAEDGVVVAVEVAAAGRADRRCRAWTGRGYSRPMSCAVLTWLPNGGRRRTNSWSPRRKRYVRLEWPCGNCSTVSGPEASGKVLRQVGFQRRDGQFFPRHGPGRYPDRDSWSPPVGSPVRPQCLILQMRQRVEAVEGETVFRKHELGQRAVAAPAS